MTCTQNKKTKEVSWDKGRALYSRDIPWKTFKHHLNMYVIFEHCIAIFLSVRKYGTVAATQQNKHWVVSCKQVWRAADGHENVQYRFSIGSVTVQYRFSTGGLFAVDDVTNYNTFSHLWKKKKSELLTVRKIIRPICCSNSCY